MDHLTRTILEDLKNDVNQLLGFQESIPRINYGPCGVFAYLFLEEWNHRFSEKVHICFVLTPDREECDHIVVRLPDGSLYDGGVGVHSEEVYLSQFLLEAMVELHYETLEKWSYGLDRVYPRFCPNFDKNTIKKLIRYHLNRLILVFKEIDTTYPGLVRVIELSIGQASPEKIQKILESYQLNSEDHLIGSFWYGELVGVLGINVDGQHAFIKHLSILESYQKEGIGRQLLTYVWLHFSLTQLQAETDEEGRGFYEKCGFHCVSFQGPYGTRYCCKKTTPSL